jgi:hypothetical protein
MSLVRWLIWLAITALVLFVIYWFAVRTGLWLARS